MYIYQNSLEKSYQDVRDNSQYDSTTIMLHCDVPFLQAMSSIGFMMFTGTLLILSAEATNMILNISGSKTVSLHK